MGNNDAPGESEEVNIREVGPPLEAQDDGEVSDQQGKQHHHHSQPVYRSAEDPRNAECDQRDREQHPNGNS